MDTFSKLNYDLQIRVLMFRPIHPIASLIKNIIRSNFYREISFNDRNNFHNSVRYIKRLNKKCKLSLRCIYIKYGSEIINYV